jgi:hypothetical protein
LDFASAILPTKWFRMETADLHAKTVNLSATDLLNDLGEGKAGVTFCFVR